MVVAATIYFAMLCSVGLGYVLVSTLGQSPGGRWVAPTLLVTAASLLTAVTGFYFGRSQAQRDTGSVRIALGGAPGAGKSVFVNVLMNVLMEGLDSDLQFTPETKTAASVIRASRRLAIDEWPTPTSEQGVFRYGGTVEGRSSYVRRVLGLVSSLRLEVADNAGELWQQLGLEERDDVLPSAESEIRLTESTFYEYVASAHALFYFIGADQLLGDSRSVRSSVDDAISAVQLLAATRGRGRRTRPINVSLIVSKADLLDERQFRVVGDLVSGSHEFSILVESEGQGQSSTSENFLRNLPQLERLVSVLERRSDTYAGYVLSSVAAALESRLIDETFVNRHLGPANRLLRRERRSAAEFSEAAVLAPVDWTLTNYWRTRRAGADIS